MIQLMYHSTIPQTHKGFMFFFDVHESLSLWFFPTAELQIGQ